MRTSHIPACQRANEDAWCGGISHAGWRDTGSMDHTWAWSFVGVEVLSNEFKIVPVLLYFWKSVLVSVDPAQLKETFREECWKGFVIAVTTICFLFMGHHSTWVWMFLPTAQHLSLLLLKSCQMHLYFSHIDNNLPCKCLVLLVSGCFMAAVTSKLPPSLPFFLLQELNLEGKSFLWESGGWG